MSRSLEKSEKLHRKAMGWLIGTLAVVAAGMLALVALVVWVDPFFQYHDKRENFPYRVDNQASQNPGIAKNFAYDSVITGSSMSLTMDTDDFREYCGDNTVKLTYNGSLTKDISYILKVIFENRPDVKRVYYTLDPLCYLEDSGESAHDIPTYLYDKNIFNDVSYVFNKDVLLDYVLEPMLLGQNTVDWSYLYGDKFQPETCSKDTVLASYTRPEPLQEIPTAEECIGLAKVNLERNILPYIEQHPDTEFVIYVAPYSMLFWDMLLCEGRTEPFFEEAKYLTERFLALDNVRMFFFVNQEEIVTNLDNYCDMVHFHPRISTFMVQCFGNGQCEMTRENYEVLWDAWKEHIVNYDYESIWK